ncbi:MAG: hypothetical protein HY231_09415 [Acidobacteria bacterium]|nr:hypothetical protein [Acidobacteriota bacterium]
MSQSEKLEEVVSRLTSEQYARLLAFAEALVEENSGQAEREAVPQAVEVTEAELLRRIQHGFSEIQRVRRRELTLKSEAEVLAEVLSDDERAEYISLAEQREVADAERLQAVIKLAQRRGITSAQLMKELGIGVSVNG